MSRYQMEDGFVYDANDKGPSNRPFSFGRRLFKSSGGGTTSTKVELPDYVQPYAKQLMERSADLSTQEVPQYQGQTYAGLNDTQNQAISGIINKAGQGTNPLLTATQGSLQNLVGGGGAYQSGANPYMGDNPYLDASISKTLGDMATNYATGTGAQTMAQFRNAGAFGGSAQGEYTAQQNKTLADSMANASNTARMQNYQQSAQLAENALNRDASNYWQGQSNQLQAAGMAPQIANAINSGDYQNLQAMLTAGGLQQQDAQNGLNDVYTRWQNQVNAPYQQLETLANGIQGATGGGVARTQIGANPYASSGAAGALGGALSGAAAGSVMGPWGAAAGGLIGGIGGVVR